jgi:hypothetical protein
LTPDDLELDGKSEAGCNPDGDLIRAFSSDGQSQLLTYTCDDIPDGVETTKEVQLWVIDQDGLRDFCNVTVNLSDSDDFCENDTGAVMIAGVIRDENQMVSENITVSLTNLSTDKVYIQKTDKYGKYAFENMERNYDYEVRAELDGNDMLGVSTLDLVYIQMHLLGIRTFDSPFKVLASDINSTNSVSATDLVELRKLILGTTTELDQSWKFVSEDFYFDDMFRPWNYDGSVLFQDLSDNFTDVNFVGLKVGDVNGGAFASLAQIMAGPRSVFALDVHSEHLGDEVIYTVHAHDPRDIYGLQMAFDFDLPGMVLTGIEPGAIPVSDQNLHFDSEKNIYRLSWSDATMATLASEPLFTLRFQVGGQETPRMNVVQNDISSELYDSQLEVLNITLLNTGDSDWNEGLEVYQNKPNPFSKETTIAFEVSAAGAVEISIIDISGKRVFSHAAQYTRGYHEMVIDKKDLTGTGIYYYTVTSEAGKETKRMVVLH